MQSFNRKRVYEYHTIIASKNNEHLSSWKKSLLSETFETGKKTKNQLYD